LSGILLLAGGTTGAADGASGSGAEITTADDGIDAETAAEAELAAEASWEGAGSIEARGGDSQATSSAKSKAGRTRRNIMRASLAFFR
jgi:hypothetical protein